MSAQTPHFDELVATQGGNPLGGPRPDMTPPTFNLTIEPTKWPSVTEVLGPPPAPLADPEATLEVPRVDLTTEPNANAAIALLDNGALPTGGLVELPAAEPLSPRVKPSPTPRPAIPPAGLPTAIIDLSEFDEPDATDRHAPRREP